MTAFLPRIDTRFVSALIALFVMMTVSVVAAPAVAEIVSYLDGRIDVELIEQATEAPASPASVIVSKNRAEDRSLERLIQSKGGRIVKPLPLINGFSADVPAGLVPTLATNDNLRSLSKNRVGRFENLTYEESRVQSSFPKTTGATKLWTEGNYGEGVGIALIDTGISPMNDFVAGGGRIIYGPDLSGEYNYVDTYGHGTVMAGIIGGDGYDSRSDPSGAHVGVAPKSWLVSVKVAGASGATDVSTVLAAMHWVAAYRDQFNIRVLNLSWGTKGTQSYRFDPLNYAVERLWQLGITVVVAAGNDGPSSGTIRKPADDPFVITVGAYNDNQNLDPADDAVPGWSSRGPTAADGIAKPDVVAPGRLIIATRSYGSTIEKTYPKALYSPSYIRGSGSSQASAVTAGAAALLIRKKPHLSPPQVKYLLMNTASPIAGTDSSIQGNGRINVAAAAASADEGHANSTTPPSNGLGSLEASRGGSHVQTDCNGDGVQEVIEGEMTVQCQGWDGATWTGATWTGDAWTGATWTGATWTGATWTGATWTGATWTGATWTGGTWTGGTWTSNDFTGATWTGGTWTGATWTGATWTGGTWTGATWTGATWTGATWTGATWTGATWTTGTYDEFTSATYDEFLTAFWGNRPAAHQRLPGEISEVKKRAAISI